MNKGKRIEEMAFDLENHTCMSQFQAEIASRMLYILGYRKQEEGRWKGAGLGDYYCSICQTVFSGGDEYNFCPNCGAKMKGV